MAVYKATVIDARVRVVMPGFYQTEYTYPDGSKRYGEIRHTVCVTQDGVCIYCGQPKD
ncbi:hypothetical protein [Tautonia marina]|uniref:hypothetical protein n=1 Tax=Tautonia marina TaxID=2653855 RepID=UPI001375CBEB|nr:hypothetical protein [Tautonia marina]